MEVNWGWIIGGAGIVLAVGAHIGSAIWFLAKWGTMVRVLDERLSSLSSSLDKQLAAIRMEFHEDVETMRLDIKELFGRHESITRIETRLDDINRRIGRLEV